jgi:hypothetical protein
MTETIQALVPLLSYQQSRAHLFPSEESARWQFRKHKAELIEAGALVMVAGRHLVSPDSADEVFMTIGKRIAAQRGAA